METRFISFIAVRLEVTSDTKYRDIADGNDPDGDIPRALCWSDTKYRDIADGNAMPKLSSVMS